MNAHELHDRIFESISIKEGEDEHDYLLRSYRMRISLINQYQSDQLEGFCNFLVKYNYPEPKHWNIKDIVELYQSQIKDERRTNL